MKHPKYSYRSEASFLLYEFESVGPKGIVKKMVLYTRTAADNVYNLAFGDYDHATGEMDDLSISNNGDSAKVLVTVASTVYAFLGKYANSWIFAEGSTPARNRLYQMMISRNLEDICADFSIFSYYDHGQWEPFKVGSEYGAFMLTRKRNTRSI